MSAVDPYRPAAAAEVLKLRHDASAVGAARRRVRQRLAGAAVPETALDDAEVVVSELLGNSVRHADPIAGGVLVVGWRVEEDHVLLRVTDGGGTQDITPRDPDPLSDSGRGLHIVDRLTEDWGVANHAGGLRTVWARIPIEGSPRALRLVR